MVLLRFPRSIVILLCVFLPALGAADDSITELYISPSKLEAPAESVANSVTVITRADLEERQLRTVYDALEGVPGLDIVRSGGLGGNTAIFLRGANPEHTLVLLDGVEVNDPITTSRFANITNIATEGFERIEVLRGPQSLIYGSDALGGVVSITSRKGSGPLALEASTEAGSYKTFREQASASGSTDLVSYAFSADRLDSGSISAADAGDGNREHDDYDSTNLASRVGLLLPDAQEIALSFRSITAHSDVDNFGGVGGDDPNRFFSMKQYLSRAEGVFHAGASNLEQRIGVSLAHQEFSDRNSPDDLNPLDSLDSIFKSRRVKTDLFLVGKWQDITATAGAEIENEEGSSTSHSESAFGPFDSDFPGRDATSEGVFVQGDAALGQRLNTAAGIRLDHHEEFGDEITWRVGPVLRIQETGTTLRQTTGTGFRAPSLYQLYSEYGSPDLDAEKSLGIDAGVEQEVVGKDLVVSATYFHNDFDDLITFEPSTFQYRNVSEATTSGWELATNIAVSRGALLRLSYTYTDTEDGTTGEALLRRPRHKAMSELSIKPTERLTTRIALQATGERYDTDFNSFPAQRVTLGSYVTVNLAADYKLTDTLSVFSRVDNLLDREYQEVLGYGTPGLAAYAGLKASL